MYLHDFEELILAEYTDWKKSYYAMKTSSNKISCLAVFGNGDNLSIVGIYKQDKNGTQWYIKKTNGTYLKGLNSSSLYVTEVEFANKADWMLYESKTHHNFSGKVILGGEEKYAH